MSTEPTRPGEPEYLGDAPSATSPGSPPRSGRAIVGVAAAAGVVGVVAVGGWAAVSLMSSGDQPAAAIPSSAVAYVSIDLDPRAAQKVEALEMVEKFPALDKELGLDAQDDLRRSVFEQSPLASCDGVDYDADVAPWIGDRAGFAMLPTDDGKGAPEALFAMQVDAEEAAAAGLEKLLACEDDGAQEPGYAFADGYVLIAETPEQAQAAAAAAEQSSLAEDSGFEKWTAAAGDPGVATLYLAPEAIGAFMDLSEAMAEDEPWMSYEEGDTGAGPFPRSALPFGGSDRAGLDKLTEGFEGMAAVLRFEDGTLEAELAGGGLPEGVGPAENAVNGAGDLPAGTGAALSMAPQEGWLEDSLRSMSGITGMSAEEMLSEAEGQTGLELPEDLERLLGDSVSLAVDSSLEAGALIADDDPGGLPLGIRVAGEPDEIIPVVDKLREQLGPAADQLVVETSDGSVALGMNEEYVRRLAADGGLGDAATFQKAVPDADRAAVVGFLDFDAGDAWVERLVGDVAESFLAGGPAGPDRSDDIAEVRRNLEALEAIGFSSWSEDGTQHGRFRVTTD